MFVKKIPLLLTPVMGFVCIGAEAAKLKEVVNAIRVKIGAPHTCFGRSSVEKCEDDCSRERSVSGSGSDRKVTGAYYLPMGWAMSET
jgi:hypothetical protein